VWRPIRPSWGVKDGRSDIHQSTSAVMAPAEGRFAASRESGHGPARVVVGKTAAHGTPFQEG